MSELNTPVIVGAGQFTERLKSPDYEGLSPSDIGARAARLALDDALGFERLRDAVDAIATTRTAEDSGPGPAPFGKTNNFPRSIGKRLNINPRVAYWEKGGGNFAQRLVFDFCEKLAAGDIEVALLAGAEAISTVRHLSSQGEKRDWSETVEGSAEDHGWGLKGMMTATWLAHRLAPAPPAYALFEHARRGRLGLTRDAYAREMGRLFSHFAKVAARNPYSSAETKPYEAEELISVDPNNRLIADPYTRRLVARDQVNQGAALVLTTIGKARQLGIPEHKWIYLHGYADLNERTVIEREDLSSSPAARLACRAALQAANLSVDQIGYFDFYSCFPIAVFNAACDELGLSPDDPRGLTVTGGLPFFGGPGNNYSMHAVAEMVEKLRAQPDKFGLVGANGGYMSKYSAGVYSARPAQWRICDSRPLQAEIDARPAPTEASDPNGPAKVETFTVVYQKGEPAYATVVGRLERTNERFFANTVDGDEQTLQQFLEGDPLGRVIHVRSFGIGNRVTFSEARMNELFPPKPPVLRDKYEYVLVTRKGHLLEVTINRAEVRNSLHPMIQDELDEIFNAYEADPSLWVAILTGAGTDAFCAGADIKYNASGKPQWIPKSGFGGLVCRSRTKPIIAAVNGIAMGGGLEICLACDLVVADEKAQFALSEVRIGVFAGAGGLQRLPRQIPKKLAMELILTGRRAGAEEMKRNGLINRIVPAGSALEGARALAAEILEGSPLSVRLSMQVMNEADEHASEASAVRHLGEPLDVLITSEDMFEGAFAFAQKRKPNWKNR